MKRVLLVLVAAAVLVPSAMADSFKLASYSVALRASDPGLVLHYSNALSVPSSFNLNPGEHSSWFNLFDLWTDETSVNPDDTVAYGISVTLNFSDPFVSATVQGQSEGSSTLWGIIQSGQVTWSGPAVVPFGNGGQFSVYLQDAYFNTGLFGLFPGEKHGADIFAKIKYNRAPDPVRTPEPATLLLLGTGLAGVGLTFRRRISL